MAGEKGKISAELPLKGWRQIAGYFGRDASTVRRWAAERQLPIYRVGSGGGRGVPVHAFASELEAWLRSDDGRTTLGDERPTAPAVDVAAARKPRSRRVVLTAIVLGAAAVVGGSLYWLSRASGPAAGGFATPNVPEEAHKLYLRGTYLWNWRTPEGIAEAIKVLNQALKIFPDYAEAHAGLAMTYNLARQYSGMSGWEAYPKAEEHARRAVELAPDYAFGQSVLAFVEFHWLWQVKAGLNRFEKAMRLDPNDANTLMWYGSSLMFVGRSADAVPILERAQDLDPANTTILNIKGQALFQSGHEKEGIALIQELIKRDPGHPWNYAALASLRLGQLDYAGYLENNAKLGDLIEVPRYRAVADAGLAALAKGGKEAMDEAIVAVDTKYYERGEALAWDIACDYAMVGKWREAMPWLHISLKRHEERLIGLKENTAFWPIRDRPEFKQMLAEVGLPVD